MAGYTGNGPWVPSSIVGSSANMIDTWLMRGYDGTLARMVYWHSKIADAVGIDYGGPGPLTLVTVVEDPRKVF